MANTPNILWTLFLKKDNGKAECTICKSLIDCKGGTTSGLIKHLKAKHGEKHAEFLKSKEVKEASKRKTGTKNSDDGMKQPKLDFGIPDAALTKRVDDAVVSFLAETGTAFNVVAQPSFKKLMNVANRKVQLKDPTTYSRKISEMAKEMSKDINDIIETVKPDLQSVGFTTDLWTSRAGHSYMSLTTHFIDKSWKLHRYTPYIKPFPDRHTGVNIHLELDSMTNALGF